MKICFIRLDKIGDLACSLPVDQVPWLEGHQIRWVIQEGMGFVASHAVPGRRFLQLNKKNKWESYRALLRFLREENFQVAVSLQAPWWVSLALWRAGVPLRGGVLSKWHSFLFLNKGLRQRRSLSEKHEADYNLEVLAHTIGKSVDKIPSQVASEVILSDPTRKALSVEELIASRLPLMTQAPWLRLRSPDQPDLWDRLPFKQNEFIIVHPGMAGSALNWPQDGYRRLIETLSESHSVVVTGTPSDQAFLTGLETLKGRPGVHWMVGELTATELLSVIQKSRLVIAPSTGIAHLGAALGVPVIALFSPLLVQRPTRWSPRGANVTCILPAREAENPGDDPMTDITVELVLDEVKRNL